MRSARAELWRKSQPSSSAPSVGCLEHHLIRCGRFHAQSTASSMGASCKTAAQVARNLLSPLNSGSVPSVVNPVEGVKVDELSLRLKCKTPSIHDTYSVKAC